MKNCKSQLFNLISEDRIIEDLKDMVAINSVVGDETELAECIGGKLDQLGTDPRFQDVKDGRKNVYSVFQLNGDGPLITFNGHTDTVPVCEGWKEDPFTPTVKDGKLYGLGSWDMKAGLACALEAYRVLVQADPDLNGNIAYSAVIDEEGYSAGAKELLNSELADSTAILIGEPHFGTSDQPIPQGITGKVLYEVTARGKSAHGFYPERGVNAIEDLAELVSQLDKIRMIDHPDFGPGNICTLKFEGGYKKYSVSVPDKSRAIINRLLVPGESIKSAVEDMEDLIEKTQLNSSIEVKSIPPSYDPITQSPEKGIFKDVVENYRLTTGEKPELGYVKGIMDANVFVNRKNIPTVVFGPDGNGLHSADEYVNLDTLLPVTKVYLGAIVDFLNS